MVGRSGDLFAMLSVLLSEKNISLYRLEKESRVCHATLSDLYNERTDIEKCSSLLVHRIAKAMDISMDDLYDFLSYQDLSLITYSDSFDLFKSNICHELKELQYKRFLQKHLLNNSVEKYFNEDKKAEALYLLSMIDYLCASNNLPAPQEYSQIRRCKLKRMLVSKSVYLLLKSRSITISQLCRESIGTFLKHNILEADIDGIR